MTINLIKELLLHYEMDYSYNIISNESNLLQDVNRNDLSTKLKLNKGEKMPLLV